MRGSCSWLLHRESRFQPRSQHTDERLPRGLHSTSKESPSPRKIQQGCFGIHEFFTSPERTCQSVNLPIQPLAHLCPASCCIGVANAPLSCPSSCAGRSLSDYLRTHPRLCTSLGTCHLLDAPAAFASLETFFGSGECAVVHHHAFLVSFRRAPGVCSATAATFATGAQEAIELAWSVPLPFTSASLLSGICGATCQLALG